MKQYIQNDERKKPDYLEFYILKKKSRLESEIKNILRKKLMEFVSCKPALKEISKEVLQAEGKYTRRKSVSVGEGKAIGGNC